MVFTADMTRTRTTLLALAILLGQPAVVGLRAQARPAILEGVDLIVPVPPTTVRVAGRTQLVHEVHVTNFLSADVTLARLQVLGSDGQGPAIAEYQGEDLRKRLGRPGLRRDHATPQVIAPGMRAVAYLWIELPEGVDAPRSIRHRMELEVQRPAGPVHVVTEGAAAVVAREAPVVLNPPLRGGPWTAIYDPLLMGGHRTAIYTLDGRARIPARFAIDWIRLGPGGTMETDASSRREDWNGYGAEVLAVADAVVVAAMDDIAENEATPSMPRAPMPPENASGNYVSLDLGRGRFAFYEHLKRGSVAVRRGDRVRAGQVIGRLGNSGSSSIGPHLHFHVSDANSLLATEGLPFVFASFRQLGAFASIEALVGGRRWLPVPDGEATERKLERPRANAVVQFP